MDQAEIDEVKVSYTIGDKANRTPTRGRQVISGGI